MLTCPIFSSSVMVSSTARARILGVREGQSGYGLRPGHPSQQQRGGQQMLHSVSVYSAQ